MTHTVKYIDNPLEKEDTTDEDNKRVARATTKAVDIISKNTKKHNLELVAVAAILAKYLCDIKEEYQEEVLQSVIKNARTYLERFNQVSNEKADEEDAFEMTTTNKHTGETIKLSLTRAEHQSIQNDDDTPNLQALADIIECKIGKDNTLYKGVMQSIEANEPGVLLRDTNVDRFNDIPKEQQDKVYEDLKEGFTLNNAIANAEKENV